MESKFDDNREEIFNKPEFMPPADVTEIKSVIDSAGKPWCIFGAAADWAITPGSAKIHTGGPTLDVSIRLKWADEYDFVVPEGETQIVGVFKVAELAAFKIKHPRLDFFAFPLSATPNAIHVT